jgi:hypothetical protein
MSDTLCCSAEVRASPEFILLMAFSKTPSVFLDPVSAMIARNAMIVPEIKKYLIMSSFMV